MNKVPHTNETQKFLHIGAVTIPPGETRDVDASLLPGFKPVVGLPSQPEIPPDLLAELLKASIKNIVPELPGMSDDDLARAATLEAAGQHRKSLLEAFAAENLRRLTDAAAQGDAPRDDAQAGAAPQDDAPAGAAPQDDASAGAADPAAAVGDAPQGDVTDKA